MTTGRINQVCQMLLLTALFHGSMDERSQTAARNSKLFTTQGTAPEHTFKALLSKRNSLLDARREGTCADRSTSQAPAASSSMEKPMLRQESLYPESRNDHKEPFGRLHNGTATVPQDQTPTRGSELPSLNGFHGPKRVRKGSLHRAAPQTPLYI